MRLRMIFCLAILCLTAGTVQAELLKNGDFSQGADWGIPTDWHPLRSGNAEVEIRKVGATLRIVNRGVKAPNVYAGIHQLFKVEPGVEYLLSCRARGEGGQLLFAIGEGWRTRFVITPESSAKTFQFRFKLKPDQLNAGGEAVLAVISETPAAGIELNDLSIKKFAVQEEPRTNLLRNGSFETGSPGGVPEGWGFHRANNADAEMRIDAADAFEGKHSLLIRNRSLRKPNVYAQLHQAVELKPGVAYELCGRQKGKNAQVVLFAIGKGWRTRLRPAAVTTEWQEFRLSFTLQPDQIEEGGKVPFVIITEDLTEELRLDDLVLREAAKKVIPPSEFHRNGVWSVPPFQGTLAGMKSIPDDLSVFTVPASVANTVSGKMPGPNGFAGRLALAYDDKGLIFFVEAKDSTVNLKSGEMMWQGDSVQIRIDQAGKSSDGPLESDFEFGLAVGKDSGVWSWDWTAASELPASQVETTGWRDAKGYFAAIRLNWELLNRVGFPERRYFTFTAAFNSSDMPGQREVFFLTPGLHDVKSSASYIRALLPDTGLVAGGVRLSEAVAPDAFRGELTASGLESGSALEAVLKDSAGKERRIPLGETGNIRRSDVLILSFDLKLDGFSEGGVDAEIFAGGKRIAGFSAVKSDPVKQQVRRLADAIARLEKLKREFAALYGRKKPSAYVSVPLSVLDDMLPKLRDWMNRAPATAQQLYVTRLEMVMPSVEESLDALDALLTELRAGRRLPETWEYVSGKVELRNGRSWAELVNSKGERELRPVLFGGYGHFGSLHSFLPRFGSYGANIIQLEYGPRGIYAREGKTQEFEADFSGWEKDRAALIESCWKNNLQLCFLISPHYAPDWWLNKHPEVKAASGFLKYDVLRPQAREMMSAFIRDLVGKLRELPNPEVIHSICLQNEPIYLADWKDPFTRSQFEEFLRTTYGTAAKFNLDAGLADKAVNAAWIAFRKKVMGDWNAFLAAEVKKVWPEIPVHSKIMIMNSTFADHAIDPELFALVSDYNGNDNYGNYMEGGYVSDWLNFAVGNELQYSMRPLTIVNAENHIIRDNEKRPIPNAQVYAANFLQFLTGASALVTWVWEDFRPEQEERVVHDLRGNIALRPGNVAAHGLVQLDVMRLAPQLAQFTDTAAEIALLYSPGTLGVQASSYKTALLRFYEQAAFTGHRVRFLSERQLASGEFGNVKMLFAVGTPNVSAGAVEGMKRFTGAGGRIVADRFSLKKDELDRDISIGFQPEELPDFIKAPELKKRFLDPVRALPVNLSEPVPGVFCRVVPGLKPGESLICLINYGKEPARVALTGGGTIRDLIRDESGTAAMQMKPLQVMLLEVRQ